MPSTHALRCPHTTFTTTLHGHTGTHRHPSRRCHSSSSHVGNGCVGAFHRAHIDVSGTTAIHATWSHLAGLPRHTNYCALNAAPAPLIPVSTVFPVLTLQSRAAYVLSSQGVRVTPVRGSCLEYTFCPPHSCRLRQACYERAPLITVDMAGCEAQHKKECHAAANT